jgi:hypothetical protein
VLGEQVIEIILKKDVTKENIFAGLQRMFPDETVSWFATNEPVAKVYLTLNDKTVPFIVYIGGKEIA